jgi:hypothetical protein
VVVSDLLWACPACGAVGGIGAEGRCACGAVFRRGKGSLVQARFADGHVAVRSPDQWVDRLPSAHALLEDADGDTVRRTRAIAREAMSTEPIRKGGQFLNRIERYGAKRTATLELRQDGLIYRPEGEDPRTWPFDALTAVQTSSSTLQINVRGHPLVSFRLVDDSIYFWEQLLHAALRDFYRRTGRGEIAEFQPRIVTR